MDKFGINQGDLNDLPTSTVPGSFRELTENFGKYKNIVIFSGAGVSTNSGIPDYRSRHGYFQKIQKAFPSVSRPEILFSRAFHDKHPEFKNHPINQAFLQKIKDAKPSDAHKLAVWLHLKGKLLRVYTQNVDGLYQKAGLPDDKVVEYHGSLLKDTVVLYGDSIPSEALTKTYYDLEGPNRNKIDLAIIMGTSMKVAPFSTLPDRLSCPKVMVDLGEHREKYQYKFTIDTSEWSRKLMNSV